MIIKSFSLSLHKNFTYYHGVLYFISYAAMHINRNFHNLLLCLCITIFLVVFLCLIRLIFSYYLLFLRLHELFYDKSFLRQLGFNFFFCDNSFFWAWKLLIYSASFFFCVIKLFHYWFWDFAKQRCHKYCNFQKVAEKS